MSFGLGGTADQGHEAWRLAALHSYGLLDTPIEAVFEDLIDLAAAVCGTPMAAVSLVDAERQWFKAERDLGYAETGRDVSFCAHAITEPTELMVVPDAKTDPRFADSPPVTGEPHIRFYAGAPLVTPDGLALGTLCVLDRVPRQLEPEQARALQAIARQVMSQFELRRTRLLVQDAEESNQAFLQAPTGIALLSLDGIVIQVNHGFSTITGATPAEVVGRPLRDLLHAPDVATAERALDALRAGGASTVIRELRLRDALGATPWVRATVSLVRDRASDPIHFVCHVEDIDAARQTEQTLARAIVALEGVISIDTAGTVRGWSRGAQELFGYRAEEIVGTSVLRLVRDQDRPALRVLLDGPAEGRPLDLPERGTITHAGGQLVDVLIGGAIWRGEDEPLLTIALRAPGTVSREPGVARMLESMVLGEETAATLGDALRAALQVISTGLGWPVGHAQVAVAGDQSWDIWHLADPVADTGLRAEAEALSSQGAGIPLWHVVESNRPLWVEDLAADQALGGAGRIRGTIACPVTVDSDVVGVLHWFTREPLDVEAHTLDLVARVAVQVGRTVERWGRKEQRSWHMTHDQMAGQSDRLFVRDQLEVLLDGGPRRQVAVLCCELTGLALVNEGLGYDAGNEILHHAAERLQGLARETDLIGRLGGNEFVLVAPGLDSDEDLERLGRRVIDRLAEPYHVRGQELILGCSVGIAERQRGERHARELLDDGLAALRAGRGTGAPHRRRVDTAQRARSAHRLGIETGLHHALDRDEFRVHLQPIVDLASGATIGAEALLRWEHPERGPLAPEEFLDVLEDGPQMVPVGAWVLRTACEHLASWRHELDGRLDGFDLHINASVTELGEPGFVQRVTDTLASTQTPPEAITIELTETVFASDPDGVLKVLLELEAVGVQLAIDDFGTGFSSLSYLQRFPIDTLKIDKAFVEAIDPAGNGPGIAGTVIDLARSMGVGVIAEGIETAAQADWLRARGCDTGQGFHFARPLPPDALLQRMRAEAETAQEPATTPAPPSTARPTSPRPIGSMLADLADLLGFGCAFVARIDDGIHEIVEIVDPDGIGPTSGTVRPLDATLCGRALDGRGPARTSNLRGSAHGDLELLEHIQARSYAMVPLTDAAGAVGGTLALLDREAIELTPHARTMLELFAAALAGQMILATVEADRDELRRLASRREQRERLKLAAQLHDGPIQQIVAARLLLEGSSGPDPGPGPRAALEAMEQGILELRALLGAVHPGALDPGELGASLSSEARAVNPGAKVLVNLPADPVDGEIVVMGELHRMARELLANVREHAAGELRQLAFVVHSGRALLRVVDAGPGGCPTRSPHGHFGLSSVQEQTRLLGGTVTVRSGTAGTAITVRVPS